MIHLIAFIVPLIYVFLRVFQQRNVSMDQEVSMVITSYLITAFELLSVTIMITNGWEVYWSLGTGGAVGCLAATRIHKKYFRGK